MDPQRLSSSLHTLVNTLRMAVGDTLSRSRRWKDFAISVRVADVGERSVRKQPDRWIL